MRCGLFVRCRLLNVGARAIGCELRVVRCVRCVVRLLCMSGVCSVLFVVCGFLCGVCCSPVVVRCLLFVVCRLSLDVCNVWSVAT